MIIFYAHGGSDNHGCEAIIRGTLDLMPESERLLFTGNLRADQKYHLDEIVRLKSDNYKYYNNPLMWLYYKKIKKGVLFPLLKGDLSGTYYSVGGDNYCYPGLARQIAIVNKRIRNSGNKTVLWGTSIEESAIADETIHRDLEQYDLIVSRESLTTNLLKKYGMENKCVQMPDAAFAMKPQKVILPSIFSKPVVGINLSPMVLDYSENAENVKGGYKKIVEYILEKTDYNIALVPHVLKRNKNNNDLDTIEYIASLIADKNRFDVIQDMPAHMLKYVISQCVFFVGARTHSTIAAYSSCVPTLVAGYSIKALGIANDLFGKSEGYVVDVRNLKSPEELSEAFINLFEKRDIEKRHLTDFMPIYLDSYKTGLKIIKDKELL